MNRLVLTAALVLITGGVAAAQDAATPSSAATASADPAASAAPMTPGASAQGGAPVPFSTVTPASLPPPKAIGAPVPVTPAVPDAGPYKITNPTPKHKPKTFDQRHETFVVGDYLLDPRVYNEFSQGDRTGKTSYAIRGATEFNIGILPVMAEGESRNQAYYHDASAQPVSCNSSAGFGNPGCVKRIGGSDTSGFVPAFAVRDYGVDGRLGIKLLDPRIYIAASYLWQSNNAGYGEQSGYGFGLEKLPDFEGPLGVYFGLYYYPNVTGRYTGLNQAVSEGLKYQIFRYEGGFVFTPGGSPLFFDVGVEGDRENGRAGSPSSETHFEPYAGVGIRPRI